MKVSYPFLFLQAVIFYLVLLTFEIVFHVLPDRPFVHYHIFPSVLVALFQSQTVTYRGQLLVT